ncbi:hypothetical protein D3C71_2041760 [compost metagenome]
MQTNFSDEVQLSFQPVDMALFVSQNGDHHVTADVIMNAVSVGNGFTKILRPFKFKTEIGLQHFFDIFTNTQLPEILQIRDTFEK